MSNSKYEVVFYFGDPEERNSLYQLKQWIQPLERLSKYCKVAVATANEKAAAVVAASQLQGFNYKNMDESVKFVNDLSPKVILYPNQFFRNFSIWAYPDAFHVFVSHGESDKTYMSQNSLQFFDYVFTAGNVAKMRIRDHVPGFSQLRCINIGRPQLLDEVPPASEKFLKDADRKTILYAPTWEGGLPQNRYGSVQTHGLEIVKAILSHGDKYQLIYKPHPFTGSIFPAAAEENRKIIAEVEAAGKGHIFDSSPFGWQPKVADLMITDVSAVAYDWLATAKPILITKPLETAAEIYQGGILGALELVEAKDAGNICSRIEKSLSARNSSAFFQHWSNQYYESAIEETTQTERFVAETMKLLATKRNSLSGSNVITPKKPSTRASLRRFLIGKLPLNLKLRIIQIVSASLNWPTRKAETVALHLSVPEISEKLVLDLAKSNSTLLLVGTLDNFAKANIMKLRHPGLRRNLQVRFTPAAKDVVAFIKQQNPQEIFYLTHDAINHFGIRLNGIMHILYKPEDQSRFRVDHNLIAYNEILSSDSILKSEIQAKIVRPEGWNITLVKP
jgi:hypothetical protein